MDDKNVLLNQLRIDRVADVEDDGSTPALGAHRASASCSCWRWPRARGGSLAAERHSCGRRRRTRSRRARRAAPCTSAGASMLDASGYVVARRQATVASKTIGRVTRSADRRRPARARRTRSSRGSTTPITRAALAQARAQARRRPRRISRRRRPRSTTRARSSSATSSSSPQA